jgi:hypothetical protein
MSLDNDFKKEWFAKARVDYFSPFLNLWLACNSWYNFHYTLNNDREHVDKLKSDFSPSNKLYKKFQKNFIQGDTKDVINFLSLMELLHYSLVQAEIKPIKFAEGKRLGFQHLLLNFSLKADANAYLSVILENALKVDGQLKAGMDGVILNKQLVIDDNSEKVFAGLIEIIYQVRCMLVHGELSPTPENHEVVKYCYLVLYELMKDFCQ